LAGTHDVNEYLCKYFGFGDSLIKWINLFNNEISSCVIVNGFPSPFFGLSRGCRQGDPISPYIFILCAEILGIMLRNCSEVKGIKVFDTEFLLSQFADDTTVILDGSEKSLQYTMYTLETYAEFSGLCVNTDKTKIKWIGSKKNSSERICKKWDLDWEAEKITILGIEFTLNLKEMVEKNYKDKLKEIKKEMAHWSYRNLTELGRNVILKSLILPKVNHLFISLPNPSDSYINELQKLCFNFIWNRKSDRIKRQQIFVCLNGVLRPLSALF